MRLGTTTQYKKIEKSGLEIIFFDFFLGPAKKLLHNIL